MTTQPLRPNRVMARPSPTTSLSAWQAPDAIRGEHGPQSYPPHHGMPAAHLSPPSSAKAEFAAGLLKCRDFRMLPRLLRPSGDASLF